MAFNRPTPQAILQDVQTEMDIALDGSDARLRRSAEGVLARVLTMLVHMQLGFLDSMSKQIHPKTADSEYLEKSHAALRGMTRKAATSASGAVTFSGTNGAMIPAGSILKRSDNVEYALAADVTIAAGTGTGAVTALATGSAGNCAVGVKLTLTSPIAGVQPIALTAGAGLSTGADIEADESLRDRVVDRWQQPPHGGAAHDYEAWAKEVPGVTRAWVHPLKMGLGTVLVQFVMDDKPDTIIPTPDEVSNVLAYLTDPIRHPTTADIYVSAPAPIDVNFTINLNPNTLAVQNAVRAELADFFRRESVPGSPLYFSRLNEAISAATAEFDHIVVSPAANILRSFGEISVLGTITFGDI